MTGQKKRFTEIIKRKSSSLFTEISPNLHQEEARPISQVPDIWLFLPKQHTENYYILECAKLTINSEFCITNDFFLQFGKNEKGILINMHTGFFFILLNTDFPTEFNS